MHWFKGNWLYTLVIFFFLGGFTYSKDWFFIQILFFGLLIKVFLEAKISSTLRVYLLIAIWGTLVIEFALAIYGNYIHSYTSYIPGWLEFIRSSEGIVLLLGLLFIGIILSTHKESNDSELA